MNVLSFRWFAKYGHFLRAEANTSALTYPVPPRTAVLGMLAAVLGLEKDRLPEVLQNAHIALTFPKGIPQRFTHRVKLRKDPPTALAWTIKKTQKIDKETAPEKATLNLQEWLWKPDFQVHIALPEQPELFSELVERIKNCRWHFCPCMGLSELLAEIEFLECTTATLCAAGQIEIHGLCPTLAVEKVFANQDNLGIQLLRLPHKVNSERVFEHQSYYLEYQGQPFAIKTNKVWALGGQLQNTKVIFS